MYHELRTYTCTPGRLPDLVKRFEEHTLALWKEHGIKPIGFWTAIYGPSNQQLFYILEWESLDEREKIWGGFMVDPAWQEIRKITESNGPIIQTVSNVLLQPTSYSEIQ